MRNQRGVGLIHAILVGGIPTPLKNDGVKVSWDDEIPNMMEKLKNVPNHQLVYSIALLIGVKV